MIRRNRGFSLIELMIAITLGMVAVAAVGSVFIYGSRNYKQDDKTSRMQDELRFAMAQLTQDLEMAGFWAQARDLTNDIDINGSATVIGDCGPTSDSGALTTSNTWTYHNRRVSLYTYGNVSSDPAVIKARLGCLNDGSGEDEVAPGSDIIVIKRLGGTPIPAASTGTAEQVLIRTNGVDWTVYRNPSGSPTTGNTPPPYGSPGINDLPIVRYTYQPAVWYIRKYAFAGQTPPVPSLCRQTLSASATPTMTAECVAQGIEDMQLEFGFDELDADGRGDGVVDYFDTIEDLTATPTAASYDLLARIIAVRVHLLGRSAEADPLYANAKTYTIGGRTHGPWAATSADAKYYRKTLSSVVLLRNPSNRLSPFELPQ